MASATCRATFLRQGAGTASGTARARIGGLCSPQPSQRSKVGGPLVHMQLRSAGAKKLLWRWGQHKSQQTRSIARKSAPSGGRRALKVEALVNVDLSPSTFVGLILIVSGAALYQVRTVRPNIARDYDIFFSSIAMLCGGILCFQGWRLDPLLLFGEMLTVSAAIAFGVEAIQLRKDNEPERPWEEPGTKERSRRGRSSYT
eukprot:CAMPEP_0198223982 /NCGR_PEP_ID=MMETSP1445-20131203/94859_1 /TAXON_ID=36898 /ORGANISM="Pyramimonas sp., Strain CCMP2087" /LENGTH=200 /DNA_ID=CAMNT_0043902991 /DNA_START=34 /DNA_END=633 /DNA_ORIENTATION=-